MKDQFKLRHVQRQPPSLMQRITETLFGFIVLAVVAFLKWQAGLADLWFGVGMLFGGTMVSKSLGLDFIGAIKDKIRPPTKLPPRDDISQRRADDEHEAEFAG